MKKKSIPKRIWGKPEFTYNVTYIKNYGNKKIKIIRMNVVKSSDIEIPMSKIPKTKSEKVENNDVKLKNNISRAKSTIFELSFCNNWDYFVTMTLNKNKQDRTDLNLWHKQLTQWIRDYNKKYNLKIKFLLIPEKHKDKKNWHIHGFISGLPPNFLQQFKIGDTMGKKLAKKVLNGDKVFNWLDYAKRFGFCSLEQIKNYEAVSKYITKYITKELFYNVTEKNAHMYYCSRGLKRAKLIKRGSMNWNDIEPDFTNDYCSVAWLDYSEHNLKKILEKFIF